MTAPENFMNHCGPIAHRRYRVPESNAGLRSRTGINTRALCKDEDQICISSLSELLSASSIAASLPLNPRTDVRSRLKSHR